MPLVTLRQALDAAAEGGYALGAFNVSNLEQLQATLEAARETRSPVIVQVSRKARAHAGDEFLRHLILGAVASYPEVPFVVHQDHGNSPEVCLGAIDLGFTSVMMDGSLLEDGKTPSDFAYNVQVTRRVVESAHAKGVSVEGELGTLGGVEDGHGAGTDPRAHLTDPDQAVEFVERTGVDALAVAIGTSHGAYKFSRRPDGELLRIDLLERLCRNLPRTHLVLHGASTVPPGQVDLVNRHGGRVRQTWGVPLEEIQRAIRLGVHKVNVDTDSRLAFTGAIRRVFTEDPESFDPREYLHAARTGMRQEVAGHMRAFGQAGHAGEYEPIALRDMAARYRDGPG
jgi:fructose-bisphosphate aldolase class II